MINFQDRIMVQPHKFNVIAKRDNIEKFYPYMNDPFYGNLIDGVYSISPLHGRSIVVDYDGSYFTIIKGSGLNYFPYNFLNTGELAESTWGLLLKEDALRDFNSCNYANSFGILTNKMEAVLELDEPIKLTSEKEVIPYLLQYKVKCPYRIADATFMSQKLISEYVKKWPIIDIKGGQMFHIKAAFVMLKNLQSMHANNILHNSISIHNYTFSLELLDFELSRTPVTPYFSNTDEILSKKLYHREFIQTMEIIYFISFLFKETLLINSLNQLVRMFSLEGYLESK